jgi:hypothetical protein
VSDDRASVAQRDPESIYISHTPLSGPDNYI